MSKKKSKKILKKVVEGKELTSQEKAIRSSKRNVIVQGMVEQGLFRSVKHKDRKAEMKKGAVKHKGRNSDLSFA